MRILFDGIGRPVDLSGCDDLAQPLANILCGWRIQEAPRTRRRPAITLRRQAGEYHLTSQWLEGSIIDHAPVSALCSLVVDLVRAYIEEARLLCIHCGAVEIAGRLIVFPSWYRAGKSLLCSRLAAAGHRLFADDVLAVSPTDGAGIALGVAPRLRRPLPPNCSEEFRAYIAAHEGPKDRRYLYLGLPADRLAALGTVAPIGGIVLLERRQYGSARLNVIPRAEALKRLIGQNFGFPGGAEFIFDRLSTLTRQLPCFGLSYSSVDEAALILQSTFEGRDGPRTPLDVTPPAKAAVSLADFEGALPPPRRCRPGRGPYVRSPEVVTRASHGARFLVDRRTNRIFHLNALAAAVWDLLVEPTTAAEASGLIAEAFGSDHRRARCDIDQLFSALIGNGLIECCRQKALPTRRRRRPLHDDRPDRRAL